MEACDAKEKIVHSVESAKEEYAKGGLLEDAEWAVLLHAYQDIELTPIRKLTQRELDILACECNYIRKLSNSLTDEDIKRIGELAKTYCCCLGCNLDFGVVSMVRVMTTVQFPSDSHLVVALHNFRGKYTSPHALSNFSCWASPKSSEYYNVSSSDKSETNSLHSRASSLSEVELPFVLHDTKGILCNDYEDPTDGPLASSNTSNSYKEKTINFLSPIIMEMDEYLNSLILYHLPDLGSHLCDYVGVWPSDYAALWLGAAFSFGCTDSSLSIVRFLWERIIVSDNNAALPLLMCILLDTYSDALFEAEDSESVKEILRTAEIPSVGGWWRAAAEKAKQTPSTFKSKYEEYGVGFVPVAAAVETIRSANYDNERRMLNISPTELVTVLKRRGALKKRFELKPKLEDPSVKQGSGEDNEELNVVDSNEEVVDEDEGEEMNGSTMTQQVEGGEALDLFDLVDMHINEASVPSKSGNELLTHSTMESEVPQQVDGHETSTINVDERTRQKVDSDSDDDSIAYIPREVRKQLDTTPKCSLDDPLMQLEVENEGDTTLETHLKMEESAASNSMKPHGASATTTGDASQHLNANFLSRCALGLNLYTARTIRELHEERLLNKEMYEDPPMRPVLTNLFGVVADLNWYIYDTYKLWEMVVLDCRTNREMKSDHYLIMKGSIQVHARLRNKKNLIRIENFMKKCIRYKTKIICLMGYDEELSFVQYVGSLLVARGFGRVCYVEGGFRALLPKLKEANLSSAILFQKFETLEGYSFRVNVPTTEQMMSSTIVQNLAKGASLTANKIIDLKHHAVVQDLTKKWSSVSAATHEKPISLNTSYKPAASSKEMLSKLKLMWKSSKANYIELSDKLKGSKELLGMEHEQPSANGTTKLDEQSSVVKNHRLNGDVKVNGSQDSGGVVAVEATKSLNTTYAAAEDSPESSDSDSFGLSSEEKSSCEDVESVPDNHDDMNEEDVVASEEEEVQQQRVNEMKNVTSPARLPAFFQGMQKKNENQKWNKKLSIRGLLSEMGATVGKGKEESMHLKEENQRIECHSYEPTREGTVQTMSRSLSPLSVEDALSFEENDSSEKDELETVFSLGDDIEDDSLLYNTTGSEEQATHGVWTTPSEWIETYRSLTRQVQMLKKGVAIDLSELNRKYGRIKSDDVVMVYEAYKEPRKKNLFSGIPAIARMSNKRLIVLCLDNILIVNQCNEEHPPEEDATSNQASILKGTKWKSRIEALKSLAMPTIKAKEGIIWLVDSIPFWVEVHSNWTVDEIHKIVNPSENGGRVKLVWTNGKEKEYEIEAHELFVENLNKMIAAVNRA